MTESIKNQPLSIKENETKVAVPTSDVANALNLINRDNELRLKYDSMPKEQLEKEYRRINADFDLYLKHQDLLRAIMGSLVEKHHISNEEMVSLMHSDQK